MTKQENVPLVYESFRVVATHRQDKSYYIVRMKNEEIAVDDCCWCRANQPLALGDLIEGYLHSLPDLSNIPTLVIK